jgi:nicotinamidase-related amidase
MPKVKIIDRSKMLRRMNEALEVDFSRAAVIQIDMHKFQMDPEYSTFPQDVAGRILPATAEFLDQCRSLGLPMIHVMVYKRDLDKRGNPRTEAVSRTGMPYTPYGFPKKPHYDTGTAEGEFEWDVMPILGPKKGDYVINQKKQETTSLLSTDLEHLIRSLGVDTFFVVGINTNNCVSNFCFDAADRLWTPIVVSDCVGSAHGEDLHEFALQNIPRTLGFAMPSGKAVGKIKKVKKA